MGKNQATINYGVGSVFGNPFNMYLFGSSILTSLHFLGGLITTRSFDSAVIVAMNYFISRLTPFPLNEFLTAEGFTQVMFNVVFALALGVVVASYRYRKNRY